MDVHAVILTPFTKPILSEVLKWQKKCKRLENAQTELYISDKMKLSQYILNAYMSMNKNKTGLSSWGI